MFELIVGYFIIGFCLSMLYLFHGAIARYKARSGYAQSFNDILPQVASVIVGLTLLWFALIPIFIWHEKSSIFNFFLKIFRYYKDKYDREKYPERYI